MAQGGVFRVTGDVAGAISAAQKLFNRIEKLEQQVKDFGNKTKSGGDKATKALTKVANTTKKAGDEAKKTQGKFSQLNRSFGLLQMTAGGMSKLFMGMSKGLATVRDLYMGVVDAARLATQGITNFGRSMFFFVSLPLIGFMKSMLTTAMDFEDQMVRVGKTTGLWGDTLRPVTEGLRNLARNTMTSHVELAIMAEQIGQLGIKGSGAIINLTELFNMLAVTTNISADTVANKMGKISAAFGWNLNKSQDEVRRLANTINYLENTTAASADEILDALFKVAAVAGTLNISAADATAFATALVATGFSAEESGTAVRNLAYYMSQNTAEIYNAMKGHEKYNTLAKVTTALNEDFAQVIIDISDALDDEEENVNALVNAIEIGNLRGGKALAAFGNSFENLGTTVANARKEWEESTSLLIEYEKAMTSTKAQMGLLKNNINDVGITLGEAFLPYINKIIMVLVPAIRELNDWFGSLAEKTKLMYIGFILLIIVAGPVVMFLGQMAHGVTLLMLGFGQLLGFFVKLLRGFGMIAGGLSKIFKLFTGGAGLLRTVASGIGTIFAALTSSTALWIAAIVAAVVGVMVILQKLGVDIAGFFRNIADKAAEWGQNLMETYGDGLARGLNYVVKVITAVANVIASFFEAFSPPKKGPLNTIDKWGSRLMETYLKGFFLADFDVLSGVGRIIERFLTRGKSGDNAGMAKALQQVAKARVALSQLIDIYNKTGVIDQGLLAATTKGLGNMTGHVQKLITLWLEYNRLQQRIKELEEERKDVVRGYQEEVEGISMSNMSLEDKVNAIRMAQFGRDQELRAIDKEKAALEDQSDEMQDQLKWQQQFVDAMMDQDDIMEKLNNTLDKLAKGLDNLGGLGGDIGSELQASIEEAESAIEGLQKRLSEGGLLWDFLKKGFMGEEVDWHNIAANFPPEMVQNLHDMYDLGERLGEVWDTLVTTWETLESWGYKIADAWETVGDIFGGIKDFFSGAGEQIGGFIETLTSISWEDIKEALKSGVRSVLVGIYSAIFEFLGVEDEGKRADLAERWANIFLDVVAISARLFELAGEVFAGLISGFTGWYETNKAILQGLWYTYITEPLQEMWDTSLLKYLLGFGSDMIVGLWDGFKTAFDEHIDEFTTKVEEIVTAIKDALGISSPSSVMYDIGLDILQGLWDGLVSKWDEVLAWFQGLISQIPGWAKKLLNIESPSGVMKKIGEQTMEGFALGLAAVDPQIKASVMHTAAIAPLAMSSVNVPSATASYGGISVVINDPVVRDDSDFDRLAQLVADRIAGAIATQQSYGGQSNW